MSCLFLPQIRKILKAVFTSVKSPEHPVILESTETNGVIVVYGLCTSMKSLSHSYQISNKLQAIVL